MRFLAQHGLGAGTAAMAIMGAGVIMVAITEDITVTIMEEAMEDGARD